MMSVQAIPFLCQQGLKHTWANAFQCKNGTIGRVGKCSIEVLWMTVGGLQLYRFTIISINTDGRSITCIIWNDTFLVHTANKTWLLLQQL